MDEYLFGIKVVWRIAYATMIVVTISSWAVPLDGVW